MSVNAPPRPRDPTGPTSRADLENLVEALIEEARQRTRRRRRRNAAYALLVSAIGLAVYMGIVRGAAEGQSPAPAGAQRVVGTGRSTPRNGALTLFVPGPNRINAGSSASIETVGQGKTKTLWRCPDNNFCGQVVSFDWAPDGRRVAFTLDEIGGTSSYVGLHVVNVATGRDTQVPQGAPSQGRGAVMQRYVQKMKARVGCWPAAEIDWSPTGTRLAYNCSASINVLDLNGTGFRKVPTHTDAYWPSWSPTGTRIAYSTDLEPSARSQVFTIGLDGSRRRLLATGAAPAWSPDGKTIAYQTSCGIQLVTPQGRKLTPRTKDNRCGAIGLSGPPVWSPDGRRLAVETRNGVYTMDARGAHLTRVSSHATTTWYGNLPGRPSWRPVR